MTMVVDGDGKGIVRQGIETFCKQTYRLVAYHAPISDRLYVITQLAALALAAYGVFQLGCGVAACTTGVATPAGLWLMAMGTGSVVVGWDAYRMLANYWYGPTLELSQLNDERYGAYHRTYLFGGTISGAVASLAQMIASACQKIFKIGKNAIVATIENIKYEIRSIGWDATYLVGSVEISTRITSIISLALRGLAAYGIFKIGCGIAACATGVGAPAGLALIATGAGYTVAGLDGRNLFLQRYENLISKKIIDLISCLFACCRKPQPVQIVYDPWAAQRFLP